jgi:hypothetical protein
MIWHGRRGEPVFRAFALDPHPKSGLGRHSFTSCGLKLVSYVVCSPIVFAHHIITCCCCWQMVRAFHPRVHAPYPYRLPSNTEALLPFAYSVRYGIAQPPVNNNPRAIERTKPTAEAMSIVRLRIGCGNQPKLEPAHCKHDCLVILYALLFTVKRRWHFWQFGDNRSYCNL